MKKLLIALVAVALLATPSFASVQNIKVSGDIESTWLVRDNFDLGNTTATGNYQNLLITQTRLRVDADLTDNVSATVALINERVWGAESDNTDDTDVDLNLAFVELREMLYSPLTVVIGRQDFRYGNSFIMDSAGTNNVNVASNGLTNIANDLTKRTALDAIRFIFDYNPLTLEFVASKVGANNSGSASPIEDDINLFGGNATYNLGDDWDTQVEGYFWYKEDTSATGAAASTNFKADTIYLPGMRASTNPIKGLNVHGELAWQLGNKASVSVTTGSGTDNVRRRAMAAQAIVNYMLPFEQIEEYDPVVQAVYSYFSGDTGPTQASAGGNNEDTWTAWDPFFENQGGGTIYSSIFDYTNAHIGTFSMEAKPLEDVTAKIDFVGIWTDKSNALGTATFRDPGSGTLVSQAVTQDSHIGNELDVVFGYDYTEDVNLGFRMGWFFPGEYFGNANDDTAKQFLTNVNVRF